MASDVLSSHDAGGDSVLDRRVGLAELIELESFREVMKSFADLHRAGIKVFDVQGHKLVDIRVATEPLYQALVKEPATKDAYARQVIGLKNDAFEERDGVEVTRVATCFTGLQYVVLPLTYEGDLVGRLIYGPYRPAALEAVHPRVFELAPALDRANIEALFARVPPQPTDVVGKVLVQLQKIVEVILFTSYRALLTSQMHLESVTASYHELQEKNRTLKEQNERLQELDKMKSNFLATVSHELRTPLTSVIGYSEMLIEGMAGDLNEEQAEYVGTIMEKGESLLGLISQILDLSRIESGNLTLRRADFPLEETMRNALTNIIPQAQKKNITLDVVYDEKLPVTFHGDKDKIRQVVINLLGNAVKFTPENGRIGLTAEHYVGPRRGGADDADDHGAGMLFEIADEPFVRISVQDSGIGIPPEQLAKVFERFHQVDNTSTREYGGTGLGLSIVKSFVEAHHGEVSVTSEVGQGTCFSVLLPLEA